jgi:hypothetical protein
MKLTFRKASFILLLLISGFITIAQPVDPNADPDVPITGIEILLGAGALLGIKRAITNRRNKQ